MFENFLLTSTSSSLTLLFKPSFCIRNDSFMLEISFTLVSRLCRYYWENTMNMSAESNRVQEYILWFNFILGSNFILNCFKLIIIHYNTQKRKKTKFEPRIKFDHDIYNSFFISLPSTTWQIWALLFITNLSPFFGKCLSWHLQRT